MTSTITRQELINAVEAGIEWAGSQMPVAEKQLLRHVARTVNVVARGTFTAFDCEGNECFCPLNAAGISDGSEWNGSTHYLNRFVDGFDGATHRETPTKVLYVRG